MTSIRSEVVAALVEADDLDPSDRPAHFAEHWPPRWAEALTAAAGRVRTDADRRTVAAAIATDIESSLVDDRLRARAAARQVPWSEAPWSA